MIIKLEKIDEVLLNCETFKYENEDNLSAQNLSENIHEIEGKIQEDSKGNFQENSKEIEKIEKDHGTPSEHIKNELDDQNSLSEILNEAFGSFHENSSKKLSKPIKRINPIYKDRRTDETFLKTPRNLDPEEEQKIKETAQMSCDLCQKSLESFSHATFHYKTCHRLKGYLNCCGKKWMKRHRLLEHLNAKHYLIKIPCEICGKKFHTKQILMKHLVVHEEKKDYVSFFFEKFLKF